MSKKRIVITIIKSIIELAVLIVLVWWIVSLIRSEDGVLAKTNEGIAQEKLDEAIRIFSSTDGMELKTALEAIEGLEDLQIDTETGEYNIKIDGQDFFVVSREMVPEGELDSATNEI